MKGAVDLKHDEMKWKTDDALNLFAQKWEPESEVKGVICLIHGHGEHSSRYIHWAEKLTNEGFAVLAFDLRGHGKSDGQRGYTPSFDHYSDDLSILLNEAATQFPGIPCFLYGHSLGGVIALYFLVQRQPKLAGAVITSPALQTAVQEQKVKLTLALILGSLAPKGSMPSGLEQEALSRDESVIKAYRNDPLVHDRISFSMGKEAIKAIEYIYGNAEQINIPILLLHGTGDRITYESGSTELCRLVKGDCTLKVWEGYYHELHNEPEKDLVFNFLAEWLNKQLP